MMNIYICTLHYIYIYIYIYITQSTVDVKHVTNPGHQKIKKNNVKNKCIFIYWRNDSCIDDKEAAT